MRTDHSPWKDGGLDGTVRVGLRGGLFDSQRRIL
jgi:hypothetical protein